MSNIVILLTLKEAIDYLKECLDSNEDEMFYESIVGNIALTVLDNEEQSGTRGECFSDAVGNLDVYLQNQEKSYAICTNILDLLIAQITQHIQDYDHPKYQSNLSYEILDGLNVRITIKTDG